MSKDDLISKVLGKRQFQNAMPEEDGEFIQGPLDLSDNPQALQNQKLYQFGQPIYEALTQTAPGAAFLGYGKGFGQSLASIPNAFLSEENRITGPNIEQDINPEYGGYTQGGELAGNIVGGLYGASKLGQALGGMTGLSGMAARSAGTAGLEYLMGEQFPEMLGGRAGAGILGALFPVSPFIPGGGATAGEIGKRVAKTHAKNEAKYGPRIGQAAGKAEGGEAIQGVLSKLKKQQRDLLDYAHPKPSSLPEHSAKKYEEIGKQIKFLEKELKQMLSPEEWKHYKETLKDYASNVGPYKNLKSAENIKAGTSKKYSEIPKEIRRAEKYSKTLPPGESGEFMNAYDYLFKQHPELYINKYWLPVTGGGATAGYTLKKAFEGLLGGHEE